MKPAQRQRIAKLLRQLASELERDDDEPAAEPTPIILDEEAERAADAVMRKYSLHLDP